MNDDFLYKSRPPLRKEFADNLYRQLSNNHPDTHVPQNRVRTINKQFLWKFAIIIPLVLIFLAFTVPADARAQFIQLIKSVAGFQVAEQSEPPLPNAWEQIPPLVADRTATAPTALTAEPGATLITVVYPTRALQTIISNPPFAFGLPQYIPGGFIPNDNVAVANSSSWVAMAWSSKNAEIEMLVEQQSTDYQLPAGIDSTEEIKVNGQRALLIRGWWDENNKWDPTRGVELHWKTGDLHYRLIYSQRSSARWEIEPISGDTDKIVKDLIKMAESIP
jgi:hypothetical protein